MNKKKITIISIVAVILVGIVTYGLLYLFLYEKNNDEIVKFRNKMKINVDDDFALYDVSTGEIVENIHLVCKGEADMMSEKARENRSEGNINIKSNTLSTINYQNSIFGFFESGENYVVQIIHDNVTVNDDGISSEFDSNVFFLYCEKDDFSNFVIRIADSEDENSKYVIVRANDSKEAKKIVDKFIGN